MLAKIASNGARTILVETANRFARDLIVQETAWRHLRDQRIEVIAVDSPESFISETPTAVFIRQVLGAVSQLDKAMTVAKLRGARQRKKALTGRCEGKKPLSLTNPAAAALARSLQGEDGRRPTLREIADLLAAAGHMAATGKPYAASVVARMLRA
jgi:DNA invertase Pin-like site-specific DNA recombinase